MSDMLKQTALAVVGFVILDGLWLGVVMKSFYREQLAPIARMADGSITPLWSVVWMVYVLLGAGVGIFVLPRADSVAAAAGLGAVLGAIVYGVYDLTNYSTLSAWPAIVTVADIAWGAVATAAVAAGVFAMVGRS